MRLANAIRDWIIRSLGGFTLEQVTADYCDPTTGINPWMKVAEEQYFYILDLEEIINEM